MHAVLCAIFLFGIGSALHAQLSIPTSSPLASVLLGESSEVVLGGSGGSPPYSWSVYSGTLPSGMSLGAASGRIQGVPGSIGLSNFTIQLQDSAGRSVRKNFSLRVNPDSPRISVVPLPEGVTVEAYSHQFAATLGKPSYTWNATTALPAGLVLSSTGLLSGTPALTTAGNHTLSVRATGMNGQFSTTRFPLVIRLSEAPTVTNAPVLPGGTVGQLYPAVVLQATGGESPSVGNHGHWRNARRHLHLDLHHPRLFLSGGKILRRPPQGIGPRVIFQLLRASRKKGARASRPCEKLERKPQR